MALPNIIQNHINDVNAIKSTYLPLSGGQMTGEIIKNDLIARSHGATGSTSYRGGANYKEGGDISIFGNNYENSNYAGSVLLRAWDSEGNCGDLHLKSDGSLRLSGKDVLTSNGGTITENELIIDGYGSKVAQLRLTDGNDDAVMFRLDGESLWILLANGDRFGGYNNHRPIRIQCSTGNVYINGGLALGKVSERIGPTWYRKYSDGWIEQGGCATSEITRDASITFPIAFSNTNYYLSGVGYVIAGVSRQSIGSKTTTGFKTGSEVKTWGSYFWYACGY